jgi:hypothetical protein
MAHAICGAARWFVTGGQFHFHAICVRSVMIKPVPSRPCPWQPCPAAATNVAPTATNVGLLTTNVALVTLTSTPNLGVGCYTANVGASSWSGPPDGQPTAGFVTY